MCPRQMNQRQSCMATVLYKSKRVFQGKNPIPTAKYCRRNVIVWGCFTAGGMGQLVVINPTTIVASYQRVLEGNVEAEIEVSNQIVQTKGLLKKSITSS